MTKTEPSIPGYDYGVTTTRSPLPLAQFEALQRSVHFTNEDRALLRRAADIFEPRLQAIIDRHVQFVAADASRLEYFTDGMSELLEAYVGAVTKRFGQWVLDLCRRDYDQDWLDYQHEIGLRHTETKKNKTDGVPSVPHIPLRYVISFLYDTTEMMREFLRQEASAEEADKMYHAWFKANVLSVALWSAPYTKPGYF